MRWRSRDWRSGSPVSISPIPPSALTVFGAALAIAILAALLAATAAVVIWRDGLRGAGQAAVGFLLSIGLLAYPAYLARSPSRCLASRRSRPTSNRRRLSSCLPRRGRRAQEQSRRLWTPKRERSSGALIRDLETLRVEMDPSGAYQLALDVAKELGWKIIDSEPPNLAGDSAALIEATSSSLFFGFVSDIAIRVRPGQPQTAIDIRSASRVGAHDFGANARRIRAFAEALKEDGRQD